MGTKDRPWQDVTSVRGYVGKTSRSAREASLSSMDSGLDQGQAHIMSDERIVGESEFVDAVLSQANERYERRYELTARGYTLNRIAERVAELLGNERA